MKTIQNNKNGSAIIEATIILPVFIIFLLTLAWILKVICVEERIFHVLSDETKNVMQMAHVGTMDFIPSSELNDFIGEGVNAVIVNQNIKNRILDENNRSIHAYHLSTFDYMYKDKGVNDLIYVGISYDIDVNLPLPLFKGLSIDQNVLSRGFTGANNFSDPMDFSYMREFGDTVQVFIFPRAGERFHNRNCRIVQSENVQVVCTEKVKRRYTPCKLCNAKEAYIGSLIYCFPVSGGAYHLSHCVSVDKYYIEIDKEEAVRQGYIACNICGGE